MASLTRQLKQAGFSDNPRELYQQVAFLVSDHERFGKLLTTCEPEQRQIAYDTMRPYLSFKPKSLAEYLSEQGMDADRQQLDGFDYRTGKVIPYEPPSVSTLRIANEAVAEESSKAKLWLLCPRCTAEAVFSAIGKDEAILNARKAGWRLMDRKEYCPACSEFYALDTQSR